MSEFNKKNEKRGIRSSFENRFFEEIKNNPELDLDVYNQQKSYRSMMMKEEE